MSPPWHMNCGMILWNLEPFRCSCWPVLPSVEACGHARRTGAVVFGWVVCAGWGGLGASGGLPETPTPFSPVQSARKFSHVLGTSSPNRSKTILPAGSPPIATSMKTWDVAAGPIRTMEERRTWPGTRPAARPGTRPTTRAAESGSSCSRASILSESRAIPAEQARARRGQSEVPPTGRVWVVNQRNNRRRAMSALSPRREFFIQNKINHFCQNHLTMETMHRCTTVTITAGQAQRSREGGQTSSALCGVGYPG